MEKKKRSLGRDVFERAAKQEKSEALKNMIQKAGSEPPGAREVDVRVKLTPANIKHLDVLVEQLQKMGKGRFTRNELIRVAITLLSAEDF